MKYLVVERNTIRGYYTIHADIDGENLPKTTFEGYSLKDAIRLYRREYHLVGKHLTQLDI